MRYQLVQRGLMAAVAVSLLAVLSGVLPTREVTPDVVESALPASVIDAVEPDQAAAVHSDKRCNSRKWRVCVQYKSTITYTKAETVHKYNWARSVVSNSPTVSAVLNPIGYWRDVAKEAIDGGQCLQKIDYRPGWYFLHVVPCR